MVIVIRLVYARTSHSVDGIRRYAERCADALRHHAQLAADVELWDAHGTPRTVSDGDLLAVQYNPFSYGRRGFAPWLVRRIRAIRREAPAVRVVLVVHEAYVPPRSVRWAAMSAWQRAQLAALGRTADAVVISTEAWRRGVVRLVGSRLVRSIPVGSNLPDQTSARDDVRASNGWGADTLVVAALGADHAARLPGFVVSAVNRIADGTSRTVFSNLGLAPIEITEPSPRVFQHVPGFLDEESIARELSAADVFLAPYEDGVSLRRTTLAAALQHRLPVIGTDGRNTEPELRESPALRLVGVGDQRAFAEAAAEVAHDPSRRQELGRRARNMYEQRLAWPVIASEYRDLFETVGYGSGD